MERGEVMDKHQFSESSYQKGAFTDDQPTLRDQFAMAALTGILMNSFMGQQAAESPAKASTWAYEYADAMLEARKQNDKGDGA